MKALLIIFGVALGLGATAQNVSINNSGDPAQASAMLDVSSTTKGMLIPRMTTVQRELISSPAEGLLVYDTDSGTFWFYDTIGWVELISGKLHEISDSDCDTRVTTEQSVDNDTIRFFTDNIERARLGGLSFEMLNNGNSVFIGEEAGANFSGPTNRNVAIGYQSLNGNTTGMDNVGVGYRSLFSSANGSGNVAIGYRALGKTTISGYSENIAIGKNTLFSHQGGNGNVAIGHEAMIFSNSAYSNVAIGRYSLQDIFVGNNNVAIGDSSLNNMDGNWNVAIGAKSGYKSDGGLSNVYLGFSSGYENQGFSNTFVGRESGRNNVNGNTNTFLGESAGKNSTGSNNVFIGISSGLGSEGSDNVFIGSASGYNEDGSDKLYIDNGSTSSPLIYGDFALDHLAINGKLSVNTSSTASQLTIDALSSTSPFRARIAGSTKLIVDQDGEVGIGTTSPVTPLHIVGGSDAELTDGTGYLTIGSENGQNIVIDDNEIMARNNEAADDLFLNVDGGNVGIGRNTAFYTLDVDGTMRVDVGLTDELRMIDDGGIFKIYTTSGESGIVGEYPNDEFLFVVSRFFQAEVPANYMTYSDKKTKENILPVENALTKLLQLDGITYDIKPEIYYRSNLDKIESDRLGHFGYVAQQVEEIFPRLVYHDKKNDLKMVGYMGLIPVLTEAIKDLALKNDNLQKQLNEQHAARQIDLDILKIEMQGLRAELNILKMNK